MLHAYIYSLLRMDILQTCIFKIYMYEPVFNACISLYSIRVWAYLQIYHTWTIENLIV